MKTKIGILVLLCLTVVACKTARKAQNGRTQNQKDLIGPTWNLVKMGGRDFRNPVNSTDKVHFTLMSDDEKVSGFAGCNAIMGSYTITDHNHIEFSSMASTRKACRDLKVSEQEILKIFGRADKFRLKDDTLTLKDSNNEVLAAFKKAQETTPGITEKYWKLEELEGRKVGMADNQEKKQYFILKKDGHRVTGFAGCNTFSGEYTLEIKNKRLNISKLGSTLRACPNVDVDESSFLRVLGQADNYTINGDTLKLNIGRRAPIAVFKAMYFE